MAASLCDHRVQMLLATVGAFAAFSHIITFFYTFLCLLCAGVLACLRSGTYLSRSGTSRIEKNMNIKKKFLTLVLSLLPHAVGCERLGSDLTNACCDTLLQTHRRTHAHTWTHTASVDDIADVFVTPAPSCAPVCRRTPGRKPAPAR